MSAVRDKPEADPTWRPPLLLTLAVLKTASCCYDSPVILLGESMRRFVEEADRGQRTLLPECLDDFIDEGNPVRVISISL